MNMTSFVRLRSSNASETGQAMLFVVLGLALFLLGAVAFAVDMSYAWFHRQSAQTAADAACTAGAMDWLKVRTDNITSGYPGHLGSIGCYVM